MPVRERSAVEKVGIDAGGVAETAFAAFDRDQPPVRIRAAAATAAFEILGVITLKITSPVRREINREQICPARRFQLDAPDALV